MDISVKLSSHLDTLYWFRANPSLLFLLNAAYINREAKNTNFMVFRLENSGVFILLKACPTDFSMEKRQVWSFNLGTKNLRIDKHQENLLCVKHWFKELDDPQAAAGPSQAFYLCYLLVN
jgi:hypothetical protein